MAWRENPVVRIGVGSGDSVPGGLSKRAASAEFIPLICHQMQTFENQLPLKVETGGPTHLLTTFEAGSLCFAAVIPLPESRGLSSTPRFSCLSKTGSDH